jgi:NADH pyrophosphatase NudC (nudix superfamily)
LGRIVKGELTVQTEELLDAAWMDFEQIENLNLNGQIREPWIFGALRKAHANSRH